MNLIIFLVIGALAGWLAACQAEIACSCASSRRTLPGYQAMNTSMACARRADDLAPGSEELLKGRFLHAFRDTVQLPDGSSSTREYIQHPGAVMVVPPRPESTSA